MESRPQLVIFAETPAAFTIVCGVSLLERLLRIAQRLGFREAVILTDSVAEIRYHLTAPSWPRAELRVEIHSLGEMAKLISAFDRTMIVSASFCYDSRLLKSLTERTRPTALIDSADQPSVPAALVTRSFDLRTFDQLASEISFATPRKMERSISRRWCTRRSRPGSFPNFAARPSAQIKSPSPPCSSVSASPFVSRPAAYGSGQSWRWRSAFSTAWTANWRERKSRRRNLDPGSTR